MDTGIFHPMDTSLPLPQQMNNPFSYEPHPLCREAVERLCRSDFFEALRPLTEEGKMFGVLLVENEQGELGYLAAYSGQIAGRSDWQGFVPAVFDYLQPDGYFKHHEAVITSINHEIQQLENSMEWKEINDRRKSCECRHNDEIAAFKQQMELAKAERDRQRQDTTADTDALIRESQFMKAELRRMKKRMAEELKVFNEQISTYRQRVEGLKHERQQRSDELQRWLFSRFRMLNGKGEECDLLDIFADTVFKTPPAGAGECCEPKLLQYAFAHGLRPLNIAMFWYGASPRTEVRHHLHYYPACNGKCKPILTWMLDGMVTLDAPIHHTDETALSVCYEDDCLIVVNKPSGLLSVPGKGNESSVYSILRERSPQQGELYMVHRLDQDTSGLLVVAKTQQAYHHLQRQFLDRTVEKRYLALLSHPTSQELLQHPKGVIRLPLAADPLNRPYQRVDSERGKEAVTEYRLLDNGLIELIPHTGRTHQLRVHCAHRDGLDNPILGDCLYGDGTPAPRLCLHAAFLSFTHPLTGKRMVLKNHEKCENWLKGLCVRTTFRTFAEEMGKGVEQMRNLNKIK